MKTDLFISVKRQIRNVKRWNRQRGWGFTEQDFEKLKTPSDPSPQSFVRVVLVPYLPDVRTTFEELAEAADSEARTAKVLFYAGRVDNGETVRLRQGIKHPEGLQWEIIDLQANRRRDPLTRIRAKDSPHAWVLAAAAHFPKWVRFLIRNHSHSDPELAMRLPGYQSQSAVLDMPGTWRGTPGLRFRTTRRYGSGPTCLCLETWFDRNWGDALYTPKFARNDDD